ncbi:hypothetical protein BDB00DRAFT_793435 [Zychaea mexicana]|uniref:uncharacterized protein n=1 Tax=Zychaea mexicana TaxID=64656 RepID=UPI0022FE6C92|nr:uncharacterized protein BDB00DRAFT_793435 [Zychaea mexicana]KAI9474833.1 hypothetical protein BDB00DRAFT_793435 [Zychaea mexicana]
MQTNNYVESWHNQLKTYYLKRKRMHRLDLLVHILVKDVSFDVTEEIKRLVANVGRIGPYEHALCKHEIKAEAIDCTVLRDMVQESSSRANLCSSFSAERVVYTV